MGKGIDLARDKSPLHAQVLDDFKDQLLLALIKKLQGNKTFYEIPVADVDDTGGWVLAFSVNPNTRIFHFEARRKQ